jgi:hypothetical protein
MFFRTLAISSALFLALPAFCQFGGKQYNTQTAQACPGGPCANANNFAEATSLPSVPVRGKWETEDFKASDASVSCAAVKYESTDNRPVLHLLCPGPDIFAPLRVHLALTWKHVSEIPSAMKNMLVVMSRTVKFKSKPGSSKAELTLRSPQDAHSTTEWITFTDVNVGLVVPQR